MYLERQVGCTFTSSRIQLDPWIDLWRMVRVFCPFEVRDFVG